MDRLRAETPAAHHHFGSAYRPDKAACAANREWPTVPLQSPQTKQEIAAPRAQEHAPLATDAAQPRQLASTGIVPGTQHKACTHGAPSNAKRGVHRDALCAGEGIHVHWSRHAGQGCEVQHLGEALTGNDTGLGWDCCGCVWMQGAGTPHAARSELVLASAPTARQANTNDDTKSTAQKQCPCNKPSPTITHATHMQHPHRRPHVSHAMHEHPHRASTPQRRAPRRSTCCGGHAVPAGRPAGLATSRVAFSDPARL
jgi:hypothetical protein